MNRSSRHLVSIAAMLLSLCAAAVASAADYYDPPGRVARLNHLQGDLSYSPAGENGWYDVHRNRPLARGDRLWTDRDSRAELQVGSAMVRMDEETSVEFLELNDRLVQLEVSEGTVNLRVRRLYPGQEFEVATPQLAFVVNRVGDYRIDVNPRYDRTTIVVSQGAGVAYGDRDRFPLRAGDAVRFYDNDLRDYEVFRLPRQDDFDRYCSNRELRYSRSQSLRFLGDDIIGYSDLDGYGDWRSVPNHGNVWFPNRVGANWSPYRDGQWIWQEPWGWTWVDNAAWGFAPSHYGRWARFSNRWGWIPGPRNQRAVYAPALVVFIGRRGWNLSLSRGGNVSIGWFPLGPREVYVPPYRASRNYFSQVNISNTVINNVVINNTYNQYSSGNGNVAQGNYSNRNVADAITAVPASVFVNSQPVQAAVVRMDGNTIRDGETTRIAPIAPSVRSVVGTDASADTRPPREAIERPVIVRTPPPARERPFADREKLLQQNPGRTLEPRTEPNPRNSEQHNVRVIRDERTAVDARAAGPRRRDGDATAPAATTPAQTQPPPLDRAVERRRPVDERRDERRDEQRDERGDGPRVLTPPSDRQPPREGRQTPPATPAMPPATRTDARAEADARARADEQARAEARTRTDEQARARAEAQARAEQAAEASARARAEAQARARADEQARAEETERANARAEARAREEAQARARADEQARAEANERAHMRAEARAREEQQAAARAEETAQANARAEARARAEEQARARAEAQARADQAALANARAEEQARAEEAERANAREQARAERQASAEEAEAAPARENAPRRPRADARRARDCVTAEEAEALKQRAANGEEVPAFTVCEAAQDQ